MIPWLLSLLLCCAFAALAIGLAPEDSRFGESGGEAARRRPRRGLFLKLFGGVIRIFGRMIARLPFAERRERLAKRLAQGGAPGALTADEFDAARIVAMVLMGLAGAYIDFEVDLFPAVTAGLTMLGLVYPDIWLSGVIQKRQRSIFRDLPDFLDTLRLAVDAGLDLNSALEVCVERGRKGPLLEEFERVQRDISLGRTRQEALRIFAERIAMSEISSFVLALVQADQLGQSIGPILRVQAEMARARRWQLAEVLVNKMPMKMLGPLVVFIFPASFIILFTPLVIQWFQTME